MKPKAKRYRIRQGEAAAPSVEGNVARAMEGAQVFSGPTDDGFGSQTFPAAGTGTVETPKAPASAADQIASIRREGLTGRQLRMARRVAQKQGLNPSSDFDAVRVLRDKGIDPFKRSNMLELVVPAADTPEAEQAVPANVPGPVTKPTQLPSTHVVTEDERAVDIMAIQRDIAKRRKRRAMLLGLRLLFFVLLPTFVAGYYYYAVATPMYATKTEFVIQKADGAGGSGLGGGLLSGTGLATSQDSITVQGYLQSREAMQRLDEDKGFRAHFSAPEIDSIQRLDADGTNEEAYKLYQKHVKIGFDPTEGVVKMEVSAADPKTSADFSEKLIAYAEERVDQLTARLRGDQMEGANASRIEANEKMIAAQERIVEIQEKLGVLSPESEVQAVFGQISQLESELLTERISLNTFLDNSRPNQAKVSAARNKIEELEKLIAEKRAQLTQSTTDTGSLAKISGELLVAQADLETRQALLGQAEAAFEAARLEANRQVRYLSVGVSPVAPDEPTYPRAFENTLLAFLIFGGIYLMVSLTASILREQV